MNQKQKKSNGVPERDSKGRLFVNLMEDSGFKAVFADKDNKKLLVSMLNHLLPDYVRVKDIKHYRDREKTPDYLGAKKTILDLCCEGEDGSLFDIEVQQSDSPFMFERIVFYAAGEYHSQLERREEYDSLKPSYSIVFLSGKLWHEQMELSQHQPVTIAREFERQEMRKVDLLPDKVVTRYMFIEEKSRIFAPSTIFCIFAQLGRFNKSLEECSSELDYMFYWFKHGSEKEMIPEMFAGIPFLDDLGEATRVAGFSKEKYKEYLADMKNERDIIFFTKEHEKEARRQGREEGRVEGLEEGRAEGLEKGRAEGLEKGRAEGLEKGRAEGLEKGRAEGLEKGRAEGESEARRSIAVAMKSAGISLDQISQVTGLDQKTIEAL